MGKHVVVPCSMDLRKLASLVGHGSKSKPYPPVNISILTKIGSKMGGAPTQKWDPIGFDPLPLSKSPPKWWVKGKPPRFLTLIASGCEPGVLYGYQAARQGPLPMGLKPALPLLLIGKANPVQNKAKQDTGGLLPCGP